MDNLKCKICGKDIETHDVEDLFKCGSSALKAKKWDEAGSLFDRVLIKDAREPRAYFGKLMAEHEFTGDEDLMNSLSFIHESDNYKKAYQFGDDSFKRQLDDYNKQITYNVAGQMYNSKNIASVKNALDAFVGITGYKDSEDMAERCREKIYSYALEHMKSARSEKDFSVARSEFEYISGYSDADEKAAECASRSDDSVTKNVIYQEALKLGRSDSPIDLKNAIKKLEEIPDYKDSNAKMEIFKKRYREMTDQSKQFQRQAEIDRQNTIDRMREEEKRRAEMARKRKLILYCAAALIIIAVVIAFFATAPKSEAVNEMGCYENAVRSNAAAAFEYAGAVQAKQV